MQPAAVFGDGSTTVNVDPGAEVGETDLDSLANVALPAVRAIVGVAVRSLDASPVALTLPQYRVLATMAQEGPTRAAVLAARLSVDASTVTRMCDRLLRDGLIVRRGERTDRRAVRIALSPLGSVAVRAVRARRREEFRRLLKAIPADRRAAVVTALQEIEAASAEIPAPTPALGWIG